MTRRILFVAEAASIAHVARPSVLAATLDASRHEIHFASSGEFAFCHEGKPWRFHRLAGLDPAEFLARLSSGRPVFNASDLERRVDEDLRLLAEVEPDVVVHDFRLTLGVSARVAGVPLLSICNAHWSPYRRPAPMPVPDLPLSDRVGHRLFDPVFRAVWPLASRSHCAAANGLRRRHGLAPYRSLAEYYTDGDRALYADVPEMFPLVGAPATHLHLGPIVWSPTLPRPPWWDAVVGSGRPLAYVTLGSTGAATLRPDIARACRAAGLASIMASAGRGDEAHADPQWTYLARFLPGSDAAEAARIVVCNGGSATAHQALAQGRPVLGICSNLDQLLTMQAVVDAGAGLSLRASEATPQRLQGAVARLVGDPSYAAAAQEVRGWFSRHPAAAAFGAALDSL